MPCPLSILSGLMKLLGHRKVQVTPASQVATHTAQVLSNSDLALAQQLGLPQPYLLQVKSAGQNLRQLEGTDEEGDALAAHGVTVDVPHNQSRAAAQALQASAPPGWMAFVSDLNFDIDRAPDQVSVLKATSIRDVLRAMGTNGWNYDLSPAMVIARIQEWDQRYGLVLHGAGFDWFEASFTRPPTDMLAFANEVYEFCPDTVEQGLESVEALAAELRRSNTVSLWWD